MRTAHLPGNAAADNRIVTEYGRKTSDNTKTVYRQSLEKIAKSDLMSKPIPISELDNYKTHDLEQYIAENELKETVIQEELITKEQAFVHKVKSDIDSCISQVDFIRLLDKYSHLENDKNFRKDVVIKLNEVVISKQDTLEQLNSVWKIFKDLSVIEDPEDLLVLKIKERRAEINKLSL